jgi:3-oxoacyl-[acyl-carrier-protein] synthase-3
MDGHLVYDHAIRHMSALALELAEHEPQPTVFVPHQANSRMLEMMRDDLEPLGIPVLNRIAESGNTSSASIPLAFATALADGSLPLEGRLGALGYGSGEAWGAVSVSYRLPQRPQPGGPTDTEA